ncbi:class I SAM-dependent methyltransferase family protein [Candidatus Woesearchaeota archaeon]|nr:class I SAM-dependent methyltransferase family protein [Candidatus Woesearchaeota archaeon]
MKLKEILRGKLTSSEIKHVPSSFEIVGDIAIFADFPRELRRKEKIVAKSLMNVHKNIKVVCKKSRKYSGKYRTAKLSILAGEKRKDTMHSENGCKFLLDAEKVYFSARSGTERARISNLIKPNENVLVMFSGCGPFTVQAAKKAKKVVSVEANPVGHKYEMINIELNKIKNASALKGDVKRIIPRLKAKKIFFDRIIMPLPKDATSFLKEALSVSKKGTKIHLYTFANKDEIEARKAIITEMCKKYKKNCRILDVIKAGEYAPYVHRLCVDFIII